MTDREKELVEALKLAQSAWSAERHMLRNIISIVAEEKWRDYLREVLGITLREKKGS